MKSQFVFTLLTLLLTASLPVSGAIYLELEGVKGESRDKNHQGWIDVISITEIKNNDAASGLATGKRENLPPITLTKAVDKASPKLATALESGSPLRNVRIKWDDHVTVIKYVYVESINKDKAGNEVIVMIPSDKPRGNAPDARPSRSNTSSAVMPADALPANHNTTRSNKK